MNFASLQLQIETITTPQITTSSDGWEKNPNRPFHQCRMVLELLALAALPVSIATAEGVRHESQRERDAEEQYRMRDFHLDVFCNSDSRKRDQVHGRTVVLVRGKVS
jgi:hypothetical protein